MTNMNELLEESGAEVINDITAIEEEVSSTTMSDLFSDFTDDADDSAMPIVDTKIKDPVGKKNEGFNLGFLNRKQRKRLMKMYGLKKEEKQAEKQTASERRKARKKRKGRQ